MAEILLTVRQHQTLLEHAIFSRDLANVQFEKSLALALRIDPCTGFTQYFLIRFSPEKFSKRIEKSFKSKTNDGLYRNSKDNVCDCMLSEECHLCKPSSIASDFVSALSFIDVNVSYRTHISLQPDLAYHSFQETVKSTTFRHGFFTFVRKTSKFKDVRHLICRCKEVQLFCDVSIAIPKLVEVCVGEPIDKVCLPWCYRIGGLVIKKLVLEETMAWLSTLGGGYSSLGDYFQYHSEKAGSISISQFRLAMEMGDPVIAAKCRLFYALSQMQRGRLRLAKKIIKGEYSAGVKANLQDVKFLDMCRGMWSKLQFAYSQRKHQRLLSLPNGPYGIK